MFCIKTKKGNQEKLIMAARSPSSMVHRQSKYKYTTPPWKDVYRKRCLKRLQEGRAKLVDRFRQSSDISDANHSELVKEVMTEEWKLLRKENIELYSDDLLNYNPFSLADNKPSEDFNEILDIVEEIQKELMIEEQLLLNEYEDGIRFEEERLCAAIQCLQTDEVICPICKKNPLLQNKHIFFCSCGIRIDTENDAITLDFVKIQLKGALEQHGNEGCSQEPVFSVSSLPELGISNLIMTCQNCDILAVIL